MESFVRSKLIEVSARDVPLLLSFGQFLLPAYIGEDSSISGT